MLNPARPAVTYGRHRAQTERDRDIREPADALLCEILGCCDRPTSAASRGERQIVLERELVVVEICPKREPETCEIEHDRTLSVPTGLRASL